MNIFPFAFWQGAPPTVITSVNYSQWDIDGGGADIVITGSGFTGKEPYIDGVAVPVYTVDNDTQITMTAPAHAAGMVNLTVGSGAGESNTVPIEYWSPHSLVLAWWLRSDGAGGYTVLSGNGTMLDESGNGRDATSAGANTPPIGAGADVLEGNVPPVFGGTGSTDMLTAAALFKPIKADGTYYWHAFFAKPTQFVDNGIPHQNKPTLIGGGNAGGFYLGQMWFKRNIEAPNIQNKIAAYHYDGLPRSTEIGGLQPDGFYAGYSYYTGGEALPADRKIYLHCNGTDAVPLTCGPVISWINNGNKIGRNEFSNQDFGGPIYEVLITGADAASQNYGDAEGEKFMKYCRQRYGKALNAIP